MKHTRTSSLKTKLNKISEHGRRRRTDVNEMLSLPDQMDVSLLFNICDFLIWVLLWESSFLFVIVNNLSVYQRFIRSNLPISLPPSFTMLCKNYHECLRQSYIKFMAIQDLITLPNNIYEIDRLLLEQ